MAYRKEKKKKQEKLFHVHMVLWPRWPAYNYTLHILLLGDLRSKSSHRGHAISWQRESTRELEETQNRFKLLLE